VHGHILDRVSPQVWWPMCDILERRCSRCVRTLELPGRNLSGCLAGCFLQEGTTGAGQSPSAASSRAAPRKAAPGRRSTTRNDHANEAHPAGTRTHRRAALGEGRERGQSRRAGQAQDDERDALRGTGLARCLQAPHRCCDGGGRVAPHAGPGSSGGSVPWTARRRFLAGPWCSASRSSWSGRFGRRSAAGLLEIVGGRGPAGDRPVGDQPSA
jgi:hypothetical protein